MDVSIIIGIVAGVIVLAAVVWVIVSTLRAKSTPPEDPGRGPTGQSEDPTIGTPSETSTPHWDRRPEGREGPL
ncbi:hypothetical protein QQX10_12190 [Demequina sp. SYSU T00039]|uniref:Uncharacterized protein n=1 Tax=Demequina lignilytica TaxID=3051663 RepID=A0AAW7M9S3_9MICO|nr:MULTISPECIES: hypothetical protein [unclassified Demequina]MDN4478827.1 hypothetical protein [Demequina sp. SYSU T00039-1]MDN4488925.1 hypothetical protein [Demequina sp. SYSU T00039]